MGNAAGVFAVLVAFVRPGIVVPHAVVPDIGFIDWTQLRRAGVEHVVIDKDNCVTLPHRDRVAPGLESAWQTLSRAGFRSVLIVSNSAGSSDDPLAINAERLAGVLGQPVLAHPHKKPAQACARQIVDVLDERDAQRSGHVAVVGDRITTDIVLASRIDRIVQKQTSSTRQAIGILTTRVLERERLLTRLMRSLEMRTLSRLDRMGIMPGQGWRTQKNASSIDWQSIAFDQEAARLSAEREATDASSSDVRSLFAQTSKQLALATALGIGRGARWVLILVGTTSWHLINHGLYLATRGRVGSPSTSSIALPAWRQEHQRETLPIKNVVAPQLRSLPLSFTSLYHYRLARSRPLLTDRRSFSSSSLLRTNKHRQIPLQQQQQQLQQQTKPPIRPTIPLRNKVAYFAALIILPTGFLGGLALNEYLKMPKAGEFVEDTKPAIVSSSPSAQPASLMPSPEAQSLRNMRMLLARDVADIDGKLERLQARMQHTKERREEQQQKRSA